MASVSDQLQLLYKDKENLVKERDEWKSKFAAKKKENEEQMAKINYLHEAFYEEAEQLEHHKDMLFFMFEKQFATKPKGKQKRLSTNKGRTVVI
jgi:predicted  nucleic acid-binding Zn-ribbon protein